MYSISDAAKYCAATVEDFPVNSESISRKIYSQIAAGKMQCTRYTPQFGTEIKVVSEDELKKFIASEDFKHTVEVQRKKNERKKSINVDSRGVVLRENAPIVGDIYTAPEGNGFNSNSILVLTSVGANNVLIEEITPNRASEINSGEIRNPVSFARSINEISSYNYFGNANNISIVANKLSKDSNHVF